MWAEGMVERPCCVQRPVGWLVGGKQRENRDRREERGMTYRRRRRRGLLGVGGGRVRVVVEERLQGRARQVRGTRFGFAIWMSWCVPSWFPVY